MHFARKKVTSSKMFRLIILCHQLISLFALNETLWITQFISKHNYPVETHVVETPDGFFLRLVRIPHGLRNKRAREVVLLVHGMSGSGENFVYLGPSDALAFYLAERGYDVWIFNARGSALSRNHRFLDPIIDRQKYWDFSWHEIGTIDLPTSINYILAKTCQKSLFYAGHSQGATSLIVMLSELPEMNRKIKVGALLAGAVELHLTHLADFKLIASFLPLAEIFLNLLTYHEFWMPDSPLLNPILEFLCQGKVMTVLYIRIMDIVAGTDSGYFNETILPEILETGPSGISTRQVWHYAQVMSTGEFKHYDFGFVKNLRVYNSVNPPLYNLSKVTAPIGIFYAVDDPFANEQMSLALKPLLPNIVLYHKVKPRLFNHFDYVLGSVAKEAVYDPLYKLFQGYEDNTYICY